MSESAPHLREAQREEDSQLGGLRRIQLYARKPRDAFAITSSRERRVDARWIFFLYFAVKTPVLVQRAAALGHIERFGVAAAAVAVGLGLLAGIAISWLTFMIVGAILHLLLTVVLRAGRTLGDAVRLPILSLAPQLLLVTEYPSLILGFGGYDTFVLFAALRILVDILSLRAFYWGLRTLFGLSTTRATAILIVLTAPIALLTFAMLARSMSR